MRPLRLGLLFFLLTSPLFGEHAPGGIPEGQQVMDTEDPCRTYERRFFPHDHHDHMATENQGVAGSHMHGMSMSHRGGFEEGPQRQAHLVSGTGKVHFPVSCSAEAQKFFDQGVGQFHGFLWYEAERSFHQALYLDPDCVMAIWGMGMAANGDIWFHDPQERAGRLAREALALRERVVRKGKKISPRENAFLDAFAEYMSGGDDRASRSRYLDRLRQIARDNPSDIEAKAFLVFALLKNDDLFKPDGATFLNPPSRKYLDETQGLLDAILAADKTHPAHHYVIHLWDYVDYTRSLSSLEENGPSAPGIAHMWHMPGHAYTRQHEYGKAAYHQEASNRVDNRYLAEARLMPFLNPSYLHNQGWMLDTFLKQGRVDDTVSAARNLLDLPRHPDHLDPNSNAAMMGWDRLLDAYALGERWKDALALTTEPLPYEPATVKEETKRLCLAGAAAYHLHKPEELAAARARLDCLARLNRKNGKGELGKEVALELRRARTELLAYAALIDGKKEEALRYLKKMEAILQPSVPYYERRSGLAKQALARLYGEAGDWDAAERLARAAVKEGPNEALPLAALTEILAKRGKTDESLSKVSSALDWKDPAKHPPLSTFGPMEWKPFRGEDFSLPDDNGRWVRLRDFQDQQKPVVLIFNLGGGCVPCKAQLRALSHAARKYKDAGIEPIVITPDAAGDLKATRKTFAEAGFPLDFPLLSDPSFTVFERYRVRNDFENKPLSGVVLLGKSGDVLWQDIGTTPFQPLEPFLLPEAQRLLAIERAARQ